MLSQLLSIVLIIYIVFTAATGVAFDERTWLVGGLSLANLGWAIIHGRREERRSGPARSIPAGRRRSSRK
jgi:hypothetical protein